MNGCLLFCPQLCWWMLQCSITLCLCPDVLDQYAMASRLWLTGEYVGWQMVGLSYRGWAYADSRTGLDGFCSRASCGGRPVSRPKLGRYNERNEVLRLMEQLAIHHPHQNRGLLISPHRPIVLPLYHFSTLKETLFPPFSLPSPASVSLLLYTPYYHNVTHSAKRTRCSSEWAARNETHLAFKIAKQLQVTDEETNDFTFNWLSRVAWATNEQQ